MNTLLFSICLGLVECTAWLVVLKDLLESGPIVILILQLTQSKQPLLLNMVAQAQIKALSNLPRAMPYIMFYTGYHQLPSLSNTLDVITSRRGCSAPCQNCQLSWAETTTELLQTEANFIMNHGFCGLPHAYLKGQIALLLQE